MRRRTSTFITIVAAAALLAGCGTDGGGNQATTEPSTTQSSASEEPTSEEPTSAEPTTAEPTSAAPSDEPTDSLEPFPDTTDAQNSDATEAALLLVDVRVAAHEGYDRVVLEFEGDGEPGWQVGYVESASTDGKGDPIELDGDAILQVSALHTMQNDMTGYYDGPREIEADLSSIEEVFVDGTFEGMTTVYLGLDEEVPFRVLTLTDPSRLVVDVPNASD